METDHSHLFLPNWILVPCQPLFPLPVLFPTGNGYLKPRTHATRVHAVNAHKQTCVSLIFFLLFVLSAGVFDTRPADYVFMLLFNWICIVVSFVFLQKAEHSWFNDCVALHQTNVRQPVTLPLCLPPSCSTIDSRSLLLFPFICLPFLPLSLALCSTVPCHGGSTPMAHPHSTPTEYKN